MRAKASPDKKGDWKLGLFLVGLAPVLLNSCAAPSPDAAGNMPWASPQASAFQPVGAEAGQRARRAPQTGSAELASSPQYFRKAAAPRPGQATTWGPYVSSRMTYTGFERASSTPQGGLATIWYNDKKGIDAMTGGKYYTSTGRQRAAGGLLEWGMKSGLSTMRNYNWNGKRFVVGRIGSKYSIVVKSHARSRLEVVLSVDGLDVVDGKSASTKKRGYILWPGQTLEVKGWRSSENQVASFVFSSVAGSYSNLKHGSTRNVGVVGMAVFAEKGIDPWNGYTAEAQRRFSASPFAEAPLHRAR